MCDVGGLDDGEHLLDQFEDLRFVPLADLHAVFQNHYDVLGSVLRTVLGALLRCSWLARKLRQETKGIRRVKANRGGII